MKRNLSCDLMEASLRETDEPNAGLEPRRNRVGSDALLALWVTAFETFQAASTATRIGDIPGSGFDRAARMWGDFEKIVGHLTANAHPHGRAPARTVQGVVVHSSSEGGSE